MYEDKDCNDNICKDQPFEKYKSQFRKFKVQTVCPLNREQLGIFSWSLMHTFAAYYPEEPTEYDKKNMQGWLMGFKNMYPCHHCKKHFEKDYEKDPPNLNSRKDLSLWVCRQHNNVNKILGKAQYECNYENLLKRWKTGCSFEQY